MANYTIDKIEYGSNIYILQDSGALQLTGGNVTGPVNFGDSVSIDDLTAGSLVVSGSASVANNLQVNTINGVAVGSSPKFTDTTYSFSASNPTLAWGTTSTIGTAGGTTYKVTMPANPNTHNTYTVSTTGSGNAVTAVSLSGTTLTVTKGTTFLTSLPSHNHSQLVTEGDNRGTATTPNSYSNNLVFRGLKTNSSFGSPSSDSYSYVVGLRGWSDSSGGNAYEIAFNNSGVYIRNGATTSWSGWSKLSTFSGSYNDLTNKPTIPSAYTLPVATQTALGGVKPWYYWNQDSTGPTAGVVGASATVNARSSTSGRYYPIESDKSGRMFVNVPWTDTNTDTNTHYTAHLRTASSASSTSQVTAATSNPYLNLIEESTLRDSVRLVGAGATTIQSSADGKTITITSTDTNTTYSLSGLGGVGTVSASGTAPLTLSASKSGTTVTISGSVADASASAKGVVTTGTQSFKGDKTFQSNTFRIRNENNDNNQAGSNPWVTQLNLGDGNYVTVTEYKDDHMAIRGSSIILNTDSAYSVYDATKTYSVGNIVWYNKAYYRCTTAITTAEAWTADHWTAMPTSGIMANANLNPWKDNTYSLGTSSYRWSDVRTLKLNGVTVPSSPVFTDTLVTQTATSTSANYEVLFSATADNTTRTETARKSNNLTFNPSTGTLTFKDANIPLTATVSNGVATGGADKDLYNALGDYGENSLSGTTMLLKQTIYEGLTRPAIWGGRAINDDTTVILNKVDKDAAVINFNTSAASGTTEGQIYASLQALGWTDCIV